MEHNKSTVHTITDFLSIRANRRLNIDRPNANKVALKICAALICDEIEISFVRGRQVYRIPRDTRGSETRFATLLARGCPIRQQPLDRVK